MDRMDESKRGLLFPQQDSVEFHNTERKSEKEREGWKEVAVNMSWDVEKVGPLFISVHLITFLTID